MRNLIGPLLLHLAGLVAAAKIPSDCPAYVTFAAQRNPPFSTGKHAFPFQRPAERCRTLVLPQVDRMLSNVKAKIRDPDLYRLFENAWPNTIDTTVLWQGVSSENRAEELAFIITGDINAMWLRDSANQLHSYRSLLSQTLSGETDGVAALYRGAINLQARYIIKSPYCNSFQPPVESGIRPPSHGKRKLAKTGDTVEPPYDPDFVFECKYELDSLAAFLQLSWDYYAATNDKSFFQNFHWREAVQRILEVAQNMSSGTYAVDGSVNKSPYTWLREDNDASETVTNDGAGSPVAGNNGLVRSFFRPSDDSTIFQYFIPANMMFSRYVKECATIMDFIDPHVAEKMISLGKSIDYGIKSQAIREHPEFGKIYAYEVDGFGSSSFMDDANIPSLLSIPNFGYKSKDDVTYRNTRNFVLSRSNPYYGVGPVLNATGGPHLGPGMAWPMSLIVQAQTSDNDVEIKAVLKQLLSSTSNLGLIHESVNTHDESKWTRPWFAWANGLFGDLILGLLQRMPKVLLETFEN